MPIRRYSPRQIQRLAHELRKPLTIIRGLLSGCNSKTAFQRISEEIDAEVSRAAKLLDEMTANPKKIKR
ncbi:MAG: histidine kinase dimerization/phospho-acceptor domain-containing protein [Patescibacteria group bacterium]